MWLSPEYQGSANPLFPTTERGMTMSEEQQTASQVNDAQQAEKLQQMKAAEEMLSKQPMPEDLEKSEDHNKAEQPPPPTNNDDRAAAPPPLVDPPEDVPFHDAIVDETKDQFDALMEALRNSEPAQAVFITPDRNAQNLGFIHCTIGGGKVLRAQRMQGKTSYQIELRPGDAIYTVMLTGDHLDMFEDAERSLLAPKPEPAESGGVVNETLPG